MKKQRYGRGSRRKSPVIPAAITFLVISASSFGIAWTWHNIERSAQASELSSSSGSASVEHPSTQSGSQDTPVVESLDVETTVTQPAVSDVDSPGKVPEQSGEADAQEVENLTPAINRDQFYYALGQTERVDNDYFDDAIFFGDSISTGIPLYKVMPNAEVIAFTGITPRSINHREVIETDDGRKTMLDAAKEYGDKGKIYIMLGGNGLDLRDDDFVEGYREFIQSVKEQYPGAVIYLQTITPVTDYAVETYPLSTNERIEELNLMIQDIAQLEGVYFLDVAGVLMNEEGKLPDEASPLDGLHFNPEYYYRWFEYLKTHAVAVKS